MTETHNLPTLPEDSRNWTQLLFRAALWILFVGVGTLLTLVLWAQVTVFGWLAVVLVLGVGLVWLAKWIRLPTYLVYVLIVFLCSAALIVVTLFIAASAAD